MCSELYYYSRQHIGGLSEIQGSQINANPMRIVYYRDHSVLISSTLLLLTVHISTESSVVIGCSPENLKNQTHSLSENQSQNEDRVHSYDVNLKYSISR